MESSKINYIKLFSIFKLLSVVAIVMILTGCVGMQGERGPQGEPGKDGKTPTIEINEEGYWVINGEITKYKATAIDGKDGLDGKDGIDGKNGSNGKDGKTPVIEINEEGYWVINGEVTEVKAVLEKEGALKQNSLSILILKDNDIIKEEANLTDASSNLSQPSGLYKFSNTNSDEDVYFYRGSVSNNYVKFAGYMWRILRINEDMSIRLIMEESINNYTNYAFANNSGKIESTYYSNSNVKKIVDTWYNDNLKPYEIFIVDGLYCEESRVVGDPLLVDIGEAIHKVFNEYEPTLKCNIDGNGYGPLNLKIGLITYDEEVLAGSYYNKLNNNYFLANGKQVMTMTPSGCYQNSCYVWNRGNSNKLGFSTVNQVRTLRPVINIKSNIEFKGKGSISEPYELK